jgi:hypothetical protein
VLGLALVISTYIACDAFLFSKGYDSFFFHAKSAEEKEIQKYNLAILRKKAGYTSQEEESSSNTIPKAKK